MLFRVWCPFPLKETVFFLLLMSVLNSVYFTTNKPALMCFRNYNFCFLEKIRLEIKAQF